jgi:acyl carrier protein
MTRNQFQTEFGGLIDVQPEALTPDFQLRSVDTWDSVAVLSLLVLADEHMGIALRPEKVAELTTFGDLMAAVESGFRE